MPRFIVVHTMTLDEQSLKVLAKEALTVFAKEVQSAGESSKVAWRLSYCDFADNKFFCEWEARNRGELESVFQVMDMPYDAIYPVRLFNVAKGDFED